MPTWHCRCSDEAARTCGGRNGSVQSEGVTVEALCRTAGVEVGAEQACTKHAKHTAGLTLLEADLHELNARCISRSVATDLLTRRISLYLINLTR